MVAKLNFWKSRLITIKAQSIEFYDVNNTPPFSWINHVYPEITTLRGCFVYKALQNYSDPKLIKTLNFLLQLLDKSAMYLENST